MNHEAVCRTAPATPGLLKPQVALKEVQLTEIGEAWNLLPGRAVPAGDRQVEYHDPVQYSANTPHTH